MATILNPTLFIQNVSSSDDASATLDKSEDSDAIPSRRAELCVESGRSPLRLSRHALTRTARRNVVPDAVEYVLAHGRRLQRTGVTFYFLGERDIPPADRRAAWATRLVGTVVLMGRDGEIITVYRNQRALPAIRRKLKYRLTPEQCPAMRAREETRLTA